MMMSVADFESTWDEIEMWREKMALTRSIEISRREFAEGKGIPNHEVFDRLHKKLLAMKAEQG